MAASIICLDLSLLIRISFPINDGVQNTTQVKFLVDIMSLRGAECFRIDTLTFLKRYSFFVKTFIVWALFSIPWNITSFMILNSMKSGNETQVNYTQYYKCYENTKEWKSWVDSIELWLRGVIPSIISTLGIIFNIISFLVLRKCEGNEVFKQLLMSLGI